MFNSLFKLYKNSSVKTPLEDFNTECLAGILNYEPEILDDFTNFLGLKGNNYIVSTQAYYPESEFPTCFVDMVLENDNTICFIENKVNSSEGVEQLLKYDNVIQSINKKNKQLCYITKWSDHKIGFTSEFKQFRWYEIADFLFTKHLNIPIVNDYYSFLKTHNMALKKEITTDGVIALKNFNQAYNTAKLHLDNAANILRSSFPKAKVEDGSMMSYKLIVEGQRIHYHIHHIFESHTNYHSEILIQFHISKVSYQVQLWMNPKHPNTDAVKSKAEEMGCFNKVRWHENGFVAYNRVKLYQFIDEKDTDGEISKWFKSSIDNIKNLIANTKDLDWKEELLT